MPIGAFASRTRLSLKALRLYDGIGLLNPVHVNPSSGYRYYAESQVRDAQTIALLRRLGMPLNSISAIIEMEADEAMRALDRYWAEVEEAFRQRRGLLSYVRGYLQGEENDMSYEVDVRVVPGRQVLSVTKELYVSELPEYIQSSIEALIGSVTDQGASVVGAPEAIYHGQVDDDNNGPVEVTIPFEGEIVVDSGFSIKDESGRREAFTTLTLGQLEFPDILQAYDAVHGWITRSGKTPSASPREVYFSLQESPAIDEPFCDVAWPFT